MNIRTAGAIILTVLSASCGDESEGVKCNDSSECPPVSCAAGVEVEVCSENVCVTDPEEACKKATTAAGDGGW
jgi:hypothetical protein